MEEITITKDYYDFLVEKAKERCDLYRENTYLNYWVGLFCGRDPAMTRKDWLVYYDYLKHNHSLLEGQEKTDEMLFAGIMADRTKRQVQELARFRRLMEELNEEK